MYKHIHTVHYHTRSLCVFVWTTYIHVYTMYLYMYSVYECTVHRDSVKWIDEVVVECQF